MNADQTHHSEAPLVQPDARETAEDERPSIDCFPVVGIGASAGGLEAFLQLLRHLPEDTGMAFVLVQHLDPKHESKLPELLSRATKLPVSEAAEGMEVRPDQVYVIPPATNMAIERGLLRLTPRSDGRGQHLPLDFFFRSLAKDRQTKAIGVVLSGTGSDGTLGLAEIKAVGGLTFAQDQESAKYTGMPLSAINNGCVDFIFPPEGIAQELPRIGRHPYLAPPRATPEGDGPVSTDQEAFRKILTLLRSAFDVDFSQYRETTIKRRITRRMVLHTHDTLANYARQLEQAPAEVEALYQDILINVTSFFRDPGMFEALKGSVFPEILKTKDGSTPLRIWTPGCSTGQEAYSLAMALLEFLEDKPAAPAIQIFATDLSDTVSLERARAGHYPDSIEGEVSPERLRRFFKKEDGGYRIIKSIRDQCVFAKHNLATDPPFSRMDLISCRNVLIYLAPPLQKRIIPAFHYALCSTGFLVLGSSETVGPFSDLFDVVDKPYKIYVKQATALRQYPHFSAEEYLARRSVGGKGVSPHPPSQADWQTQADRIVLGEYAPVGVLVNDRLEVLQFRGRTGPYLEPPTGEASFSLLKMAREGLFGEMQAGIAAAREQNEIVLRPGVRVRDEGRIRIVDLKIIPVHLPDTREAYFLILFEEPQPPSANELTRGSGRALRQGLGNLWPRIAQRWRGLREALSQVPARESPPPEEGELVQLRREVAAMREHQQSIIEQQEASNEELRSANEEVLSSNEELQSTNEELETAKEELQSVNEELTTVNEQLQSRNAELSQLNNDLNNFLGSAQIAILMLGSDLHIRRFTPTAGTVLNLLPTDVGRPIGDLRRTVDVPDLEELIREIIKTAQVKTRECRDREGRWYGLHIHPYRTADNRIDGAVVALLDINDTKRAQEQLRESTDYAEAIVDTVREPLLILRGDLRVKSANQSFYRAFGVSPEQTEDRRLYELGNGQWDIPRLRMLLEEMLPSGNTIEDFEVEHDFLNIGCRTMRCNARRLVQKEGGTELILLAIEDISERSRMEQERAALLAQEHAVNEQLRESQEQLQTQTEALRETDRNKDEFLATLAHELRNPLAPISNAVDLMGMVRHDPAQVEKLRQVMARQMKQIIRLMDDLMDASRIRRGKLELRKERTQLSALLDAAVEATRPLMEEFGQQLTVRQSDEPLVLEADPTRFTQVLVNLLNNASKYSPPSSGQITVTTERMGDQAVVRVQDNGLGLPVDKLAHIFEMFTQLDRSAMLGRSGLGIGLNLVQKLVELHGGKIEARSDGLGRGSEFIVHLPLLVASPADERESPPPVEHAPAHTYRILLVEDSKDVAALFAMLLRAMGQEVRTVHDGRTALEQVHEYNPDLVFSDISMAGMSGYELAKRVREQPELGHVILVAVTGYGQPGDREHILQAGFDHHLVKPVQAETLQALFDVIASRERKAV
jgi:two-component system CheB/CheR fusion protein